MDAGSYRARSGTELIDAALQLIRSQFPALLSICAIGIVPQFLLQLIVPHRNAGVSGSIVGGFAAIILGICVGIAWLVINGALIQALSAAYKGEEIDVGRALSVGLAHSVALFLSSFAMWFVVALGLVALIIPGFIFFAFFFVTWVVIVVEDEGAIASMSRSYTLCRDSKARILGISLAGFLGILVVSMVLGIIVGLTTTMLHSPYIAAIIQAIASALLSPIFPALMVVQYYDARIRKEGLDVELMAKSLGTTPPSSPAVA